MQSAQRWMMYALYSEIPVWDIPIGWRLLHTLLILEILFHLAAIRRRFLSSHSQGRGKMSRTFECSALSAGLASLLSTVCRLLEARSWTREWWCVDFWAMLGGA